MSDKPVAENAAECFGLIDLRDLLSAEGFDGVNDFIIERDKLFDWELGGASSGCSHNNFAYR